MSRLRAVSGDGPQRKRSEGDADLGGGLGACGELGGVLKVVHSLQLLEVTVFDDALAILKRGNRGKMRKAFLR